MFIKYRPLYAPEGEGAAGTVADPATPETPVVENTETVVTTETSETGDGAQAAETEPTAGETPPASAVAKRIDALTAEKWEFRRKAESAEARAAAAETMLAEMQRKATASTTAETTTAPAADMVPASEVERRAATLAESRTFAEKCTRAYNDAKAQFPDFDNALNALKTVSPSADGRGQPALTKEFLEAIFEAEAESDTGAKAYDIMYALGKDTAAADRIMSLPLARQAVAIAKYASKVQPKAAPGTVVSGAPAPIKPRVGAGSTVTTILPSDKDNADKMSTADWMKARDKELKAKNTVSA